MDISAEPFLIGSGRPPTLPLQRYLPRLPEDSLSHWLRAHVPPGSWVLDPLGLHPQVSLEAARAGYRVLVACNHPLMAFILQVLAQAPPLAAFQAALAHLLTSRRGDQRLEVYLSALYQTPCPRCKATIPAQGFLWQRGAAQPYARLLHCPHCGEQGEHTLAPEDGQLLAQIGNAALHRARALARIATEATGEARAAAEALLLFYPPRALTVLFTLLNRIEGPGVAPEHKPLLTALLISLCDRATTLWPWPEAPLRPRALQTPPTFIEHNLMLELEHSPAAWTAGTTPLPLTHWPDLPPESGGICLFRGRMRALAAQPHLPPVRAVLVAITRPSPAFWSLSTLWSGWLWGEEVARPLYPLLNPRTQSWHWLAGALQNALQPAHRCADPAARLWFFGDELTPATALAGLLGPHASGWGLAGLAFDPDAPAVQSTWQTHPPAPKKNSENPKTVLQQAVRRTLADFGEPADYLPLYLAGLLALLRAGLLPAHLGDLTPGYAARLQAMLDEVLADTGLVTRLHARAEGESGPRWWLAETPWQGTPLADRVEKAMLSLLLNQPEVTREDLAQALRRAFPGWVTPRQALVQAILTSYAQPLEADPTRWQLRPQEQPTQRRRDLNAVTQALRRLAERLGYRVEGETPLLWVHPTSAEVSYAFYGLASAMVTRFLQAPHPTARHHVLVLPGSRAGLLAYKMQRDPRLATALQRGWHVLKFRHLHHVAGQADLSHDLWEALLDSDPPLWRETAQMSMF